MPSRSLPPGLHPSTRIPARCSAGSNASGRRHQEGRHEDHIQTRLANLSNNRFAYDTLHKRLQELAFLNKGVRIRFQDARNNEGEEFYYERGILEFVEHLNRASEAIHLDRDLSGRRFGGRDILLKSCCNTHLNSRKMCAHVNNIHTHEGGTHVSGFRSALTRYCSILTARRKTSSKIFKSQAMISAKV